AVRPPLPVAAVGRVITGLLVFCGFQLNPREAQAKDFPGTGDAIDGRQALTDAGISAGVMKPFVVLVENGGDRRPIVARLKRTPGVAAAVAPTGPGWVKGGTSLIEAWPAYDGSSPEGKDAISRVKA